MDTIIIMIESDRYCVDIMQQNLAAIGLLRSGHEKIMKNHLETCFLAAVKTESIKKKKEKIEEIKKLMTIYNK
jgi:CsoR family transcriptional regulator, copper-sensing transcriptional repressor